MILFSKCPKTMYFSKGNSSFSGVFGELKISSPPPSFFSSQLNLRRESLLLSEEYFSTFFYCGRKSFFLFGVNVQMDSHYVSHEARGPKWLCRWRKMRSRAGGAPLLRRWGLPPACTAAARMHTFQEVDQALGGGGHRDLAWS